MKELTIEQKAQRYDEVIKKLKILHDDWATTQNRAAKEVEEIFSELKESNEGDDEKLREQVIYAINQLHVCECTKDKLLTWLEKQGEYKSDDKVEQQFHEGDWVVISTSDGRKIVQIASIVYSPYDQPRYITSDCKWFDNKTKARLWDITKDAKDGDVIYSRHNTESFEWIGIFKSLDKENKRVFFYGFWHDIAKSFSVCGNEAYVLYGDFSPATKEQRGFLFQKMKETGYEWNAEKKELKKIKPTFKVGDWITNGDRTEQISEIDNNYYRCFNGNHGYGVYVMTIVSTDTDFHLWTVEDAKAGDVLVDEDNNIGIHKDIEGIYWNSYIYLGCDGKLRGFSIGGGHKQANTRPATKEQCDFFFKKLKEAGYEWDAEKKELKKINTYCQENCKGFQETGKCFCDGECKAKKEHDLQDNNFHQIEKKPVDILQPMFNVDDIISDGISEVKIVNIDKKNKCYNVTNDEIENDAYICNWVIYFKDQEKWKVKNKDNKKHSQSKQEWSKEDEETLDYIIDYIEKQKSKDTIYTKKTEVLEGMINFLKSLKNRVQHQNTWKPSEEQIRILELVTEYWKPNDIHINTLLWNIIDNLKNL